MPDERPRATSAAVPQPTSPLQGARPSVAKIWQTEMLLPARRMTFKRARGTTNASALNEAIWSTQVEDDVSDDSMSSSDEDETCPTGNVSTSTKSRDRKSSAGSYSKFNIGNENYRTRGRVSKQDGRLNISVNETNNRGYLAKALGATFLSGGKHLTDEHEGTKTSQSSSTNSTIINADVPCPSLNIVIMVIGSRGDIQPFLRVGKDLKKCGHRVRIATHPAFKEFVQKDSGLEFFSVGGDPADLMAFMVKNPGMIPTIDTLKTGEVGKRREQMAEMFEGFWRACINTTDDEKDVSNLKMLGENAPFVADAIIANPPSFAHIHCAERLGVPLHLMFTFPYTPTQSFPHPLANIKKSNVDPGYTNFISYPLVEMMTWQGLGDLVNDFRVRTLGLEPVSTLWAPGQVYRLKVPYTYLWSPGLVPKPKDWGPEIDIAGFVFLDLASKFEPPDDLVKFLNGGDPPVYIGFGSIVIDDPDKFTQMIFEAVKLAGVRALVSKGWGGLGDNNVPDNIFMLDNTPHDWLFPKVRAVVHHGGAGTTAIGLKCGKPTMIVPFFGDQPFWGKMVGQSGAGPNPVPYKHLTPEKLAEGIRQCLTDEAEQAARKLAQSIEAEGDGANNAVASFHRSLVLKGQHSMRCSILDERVAVWSLKNTKLRLSALAAELLVEKRRISWKQLRLIRHNEWNDFEGPGEPITGAGSAIVGTLTGFTSGIGSVPFRLARISRKRSMYRKGRIRSSNILTKHSGSGEGPRRTIHGYQKSSNFKNHATNPERRITDGSKNASVRTENENCAKPQEVRVATENLAIQSIGLTSSRKSGDPLLYNTPISEELERNSLNTKSGLSYERQDTAVEEIAQDVGEGIGKAAEAVARAPMDLALSVAQGFHNAPRLYGDTTVRRPTRITGMRSGLKAAGREFVYGIYDGCSGLVLQPYNGAKRDGAVGFVKGLGMGFTGFILKDLAAVLGPFAYTFKGVHKEILKSKQPTGFIRKARIMQGQRELKLCSEAERKDAIRRTDHGWDIIQQFWMILDEKKGQGWRGKALARKEMKLWKKNGAFENVDMAEKVLAARKRGESLEGVFHQQIEESKQAERPREGVLNGVGEWVNGYGPADPKADQERISDETEHQHQHRKRRHAERKATV